MARLSKAAHCFKARYCRECLERFALLRSRGTCSVHNLSDKVVGRIAVESLQNLTIYKACESVILRIGNYTTPLFIHKPGLELSGVIPSLALALAVSPDRDVSGSTQTKPMLEAEDIDFEGHNHCRS